jgi:predicted kinase
MIKDGANQPTGNGVIILLHGVPGVGKISTAGKVVSENPTLKVSD